MNNRNRIEELENSIKTIKKSTPSDLSNPGSANHSKAIAALAIINDDLNFSVRDEFDGDSDDEDKWLAFCEKCDDENSCVIDSAIEEAETELYELIINESEYLAKKLIHHKKKECLCLNMNVDLFQKLVKNELEKRYENLTTDGMPSVDEDIEFLSNELLECFDPIKEIQYTVPIVHKGNLNIPVNGLFRFQQIGFGKITGVGFTVYYDGDEYRDGKLSIPDGYSVLENYRDYAVERIKEIAHNDDYFSNMILDSVETEITANGGDDNYMDVSGIFRSPETGFETSIEISFCFGEPK